MDKTIIVRVVSDAGRNRLEIDPKATCEELKEMISAKIGVPARKIKLYSDQAHRRPYKGTDSSSLKKAGITHGAQVFVPAKNAKMQDIIHVPKQAETHEEEKKEETKEPKKEEEEEKIDTNAMEEGLKSFGIGKKKTKIENAKHVPFEHHLTELRAKCKKKHTPEQRCQDCIPLTDISYKMKPGCTSHKPYPEGMCNK